MKSLKAIKWMLISLILAIIISLLQYYNYLGILQKINKSEKNLNDGYIIYSLQHEANPMDKDLESFNALYNLLNENNEYEYFEIYNQYLEMPNQKGLFYENVTDELLDQCVGINCIQLSSGMIENYDIVVSKGRTFTYDDFIHENNEAIPVLMGMGYSSLYSIGDVFEVEYLFNKYKIEIIGFLSEGNSIHMASYNIELDKYIVMPSFIVDSSVPITDGLKIHYANKTSGIVRLSEANINKFDEIIVPLLENANVGNYTWTITPLENQYKERFHISIEQNKNIIVICVILLLLGEIYLINNFSKYKLKKLRLISGQNMLYGLFTFVFTSIVCISVGIGFGTILGIKLIRYYHFVYIGLLSFVIVSFNYILNKYKSNNN